MNPSTPSAGRPAAHSRPALAAGLSLLILLAGTTAAAAPAAAVELRRAPASVHVVDPRGAFRDRRYAEAYARFAEQADAGDSEAAWMALTLVTLGPTMFGAEWSATAGQLQRWHRLAERHLELRGRRIPEHDRGE